MKEMKQITTFQELRQFKCEICGDTGYVHIICNQPGYEGITLARKCECITLKNSLFFILKSGIQNIIDDCTFQSFNDTESWQKILKNKCMEFSKISINGSDKWMMICGQIGCGKTHLAIAIMRDILFAGKYTRYFLWRDIALQLKCAQHNEEEYYILFNSIMNPQLIYIDDFFKGNITEADKNIAYDIINGRYMRQKQTLITSEKTFNEIIQIDEAVGSRIKQKTGEEFYIEIKKDSLRNFRMHYY